MQKYLISISLVAALTACGEKTPSPTNQPAPANTPTIPAPPNTSTADKNALVEQAKGAIQMLGGTLKGELETAMKNGGPENALDVCKKRAPEIAQAVSAEKGLTLTRISLKNRNPDMGKANEWQTKVLQDFETKKAAGTDPATLVYSEIVDNEFRFMKAIPVGSVCLTCHGTAINPAITAKLGKLYPDDKATEFKEGDLRGAFAVVKTLTP